MADEKNTVTEEVIFEINVEQYEQALAGLTSNIKALQSEQKRLKELSEAGATGAAEGLEKVNAQLKVQQQEYRTTQNVLVGYLGTKKQQIDLVNLENNSIQQNRDLLKQLTAQIITTQKPTQEFINKVKGVSEALKTQEAALGDTRRNVGNYRADFEKALGSLGSLAGSSIAPLQKNLEAAKIGFKFASDGANAVVASVAKLNESISAYTATQEAYAQATAIASEATKAVGVAQESAAKIGFKYGAAQATVTEVEEAQAAVAAAVATETEALAAAQIAGAQATAVGTVAMKVFQAAVAATGIGLLVIAVALLIDYFRKFDPIVDAIEQGFAAFGAAIRETQQALVSFLSGNINAFDDLGGKIKEAAGAAIELKKAQQELADQMSIQDVANAKASQQYSELILQSKNRTLAEKDRLAFLKEAEKVERENFEQRTELSKKNLDQAIEGARIVGKLNEQEVAALKQKGIVYAFQLLNEGRITQEEVDKLKQAEIDRIAILQESTNRLEKNQNAQDKLRDDAIAKAEKAAQKAEADLAKKIARLKRENEEDNAALKLLRENALLQEEIKLQTGKTDEQIDAEFAARNQKKFTDFKEFAAAQLKEQERINKESARIQLENRQFAEAEKQLRDNAEKQLELEALYGERALAQLGEFNASKEEIARYGNEAQEAIDVAFAESNYETFAEFYAAKKELYKEDVANLQQAERQKEQAQKANLQASTGIANSLIGLVQNIADAQGAGAEFAKGLAFVQILTQEAISIATAVTGATASGAATGPGAIGTIPAFIATLVASVTAVIGGAISLLAKPVPKFARGVIGINGPGTGTSDDIDAKISKGESVMTADATFVFHKELAAMERAVGNTPNYQFGAGNFAGGLIGVSNVPSGDAGFTTRRIRDEVEANRLTQEAIANGFKNAPAPILDIREFEAKQRAKNRSVETSELT